MNPPNDFVTELMTGEREEGAKEYELTLTINGIAREYKGDYDTLLNNEWNEIVSDLIDSIK